MERVIALIKTLLALVAAILLLILEPLIEMLTPKSLRRHDIKGKIVVVTGGGSGIGRSVAQRLAKRGAKIISWDVNATGNAETVKIIQAEGGACKAYTVDLCDRTAIFQAAKQVKVEFGKVDILLNNAGVVVGKDFLDIPDEMILRTFNVNTFSNMWTCKAFLPDMMSANSGQIITIASSGGLFGIRRQTEYGASKFAAVGFDEALSQELEYDGYNGISLTLVCPFFIDTGMFKGVGSSLIPILNQEYVADEIADAILMKKRQLILPSSLKICIAIKGIFTIRGQKLLERAMGIAATMEQFTGRAQKS